MMKNFRLIVLLLCGTIALSSCHSTRTLATWERAGIAPRQYSKMVVLAIAPTLATRSTIERTIAAQFTKKHLTSNAASDVLTNVTIDTGSILASVRHALAAVNADVLLVIKHGDVVEGITTEHGDMDLTGYGRMVLTRMESRLYDPVANELLMTVDTESNAGGNDNVEDIAKTLASELISQFKKKAIFFPK